LTPSPTTCANPQSAAGFRIIAREHALADCKETLVWKAPFSCEELSARKDGATLKIKIGERSVVWFYGADIDIVAPLATGQLTIGISDDSTAACPGVQHVLAADTDLVMFTGDPRDEGRPAQYLSPSGPWVEAEYAYGSQQPFWRARITSPVTTLRVYNRRSKRFVTPALSPDLEGWFNVTDREDLRRLIPEQRHLEFVTETAESKLVMAFGDTFASSQSPNDIRDLTNPGRNRTAIVATDLEF
jgi:hypothetical protein